MVQDPYPPVILMHILAFIKTFINSALVVLYFYPIKTNVLFIDNRNKNMDEAKLVLYIHNFVNQYISKEQFVLYTY